MSEIILHHYAESPFAEKIRLILGFKLCGGPTPIDKSCPVLIGNPVEYRPSTLTRID